MKQIPRILPVLLLVAASGCGDDPESTCPELSGTPWVPNVASISAANHDASVEVTRETQTGSGSVVGYGTALTGKEVIFTFTVGDLGTNGSVTLEGKVTGISEGGPSTGRAVLTSLSDGTNEFVNLNASCLSSGLASTSCKTTTTEWPTMFINPVKRYQIAQFYNSTSVNTIPSCNWSDGAASPNEQSNSNPNCPFNQTLWLDGSGKLRAGQYTARYVIYGGDGDYVFFGSDSGPEDRPSWTGIEGSMELTITQKKDNSYGGAMDINLILVGDKNVVASRTDAGKRNLDTMMDNLNAFYNQTNTQVKIGAVNVYEWGCAEGGSGFGELPIEQLGNLFVQGSGLLPSSAQGRSMNLYLVSNIDADTSGTVVGISGGINGPLTNGTDASGLAFSSFDELDTFNPNCTSTPCSVASQEYSFVDMGVTIAHEMGHYLGLNHPTESGGSIHDWVNDTPVCTRTASTSIGNVILSTSCAQDTANSFKGSGGNCATVCPGYTLTSTRTSGTLCPTREECQFNHIMWWTGKGYYKDASGVHMDGNLFSPGSSRVINYNAYVQ